MKRFNLWHWVEAMLLLVVAVALVMEPTPVTAQQRTLQTATNFAQRGNVMGRTAPTQALKLTVTLAPTDRTALNQFLQDVSNPQSPTYGHYLTPQEYMARFFSPQGRQQVANFLHDQGFTVTDPGPSPTLDATGTVAQAETAFAVTFSNYQLPSGRVFYANDRTPALPLAIAAHVDAITGLDNGLEAEPDNVPITTRPAPHVAPRTGTPTGCTAAVSVATSNNGFTPNQLKTAYDLDSLRTRGYEGQGETVAVYGYGLYNTGNLTQFQTCFGTSVPVETVLTNGRPAAGGSTIEPDLDIQIIIGLAPRLSRVLYYADTLGLDPAVFRQVGIDNRAKVLNISYSFCELLNTSQATTLDGVFAQLRAQGISVVTSSGDYGSQRCSRNNSSDTRLSVSGIAASVNVTSVGGTQLTLNTNNSVASDVVWNTEALFTTTGLGAGGGGLSTVFTRPVWQTGPGVVNAFSNGNRQVVDLAANGSDQTADVVYLTGYGFVAGGDGTSAAAPTIAAGFAVVNSALIGQSAPRLGFANPALYMLAASGVSTFRDITVGDNCTIPSSPCDADGIRRYPATPNYDLPTGLGAPLFGAIATALLTPALAPPPHVPAPTSVIGSPAPRPAIHVPAPTVVNTPIPQPIRH